MLERMLDEVMTEYYDHTLADVDMIEHRFSRRHERAMKRIFKCYEINTVHLRPERETQHTKITYKNAKKLGLVALILVFLALITGFTAVKFFSQNFHGDVYEDNTNLFVVNTENCPTIIEEKYRLTSVPNGFEIVETDRTDISVYTLYCSSSKTFSFVQCVKQEFDVHLNTEYHELEVIDINGQECLIVDHSDNEHNCIEFVWSNNNYVFELVGDLSREEAILLAKSIETS